MHGKLVLVLHDRDEACLRDLERMDPQSPAKLGLRWPGKGIIRSSHELLDLSYFFVFCFVLFFSYSFGLSFPTAARRRFML